MLYLQEWSIPKVMPVVKPDVFSMDGVIAWLETMPADQTYNYHDCRGACLYGQYLAACGHSWNEAVSRPPSKFMRFVYGYVASGRPWTFGAALDRARSAASRQRGE